MVWVKRPQPGVIYVHTTELGEPRVSRPGALALMHLEQVLLNACVNTSGDDALDLHSLPRKWMLVVPVAVIRSDATSVSWRGSRQVTVAPQEFALGKGFVKLSKQFLRGCGGEETREGLVCGSQYQRPRKSDRLWW